MKKNDRCSSLFWAALGFYVAYEGVRLEIGSSSEPQAGYIVFWSGVILAGLSLGLFFQTFLSKNEGEEKKALWHGIEWPKGAKIVVSLLFYAFVLKSLGFLLSTFFLLLFLLKGLEPQKWRVALALSIVVTVFCQIIFGMIFELRLPGGVFGRIFF